MKSEKQVAEYLDEAFDKVWYIQSCCYINEGLKDLPEKIVKKHLKERERIQQKYGMDWLEGMDTWEYGFLSGVLATLRQVINKDEHDKRFLNT